MKQHLSKLRSATATKWGLLTLAVLAFGLYMSQRPSRKHPSPADPGMWLIEDKHPEVRPTGPGDNPIVEDPNHSPVGDPNAGDVPDDDPGHAVVLDPNAGDEPDLDDDDDSGDEPVKHPHHESKDHVPEDPHSNWHGAQNEVKPRVVRWHLYRVAPGSDFGVQDDWVLTLTGTGFVDGEVPPVVHLGDKITLDDVFLNQNGMMLYARVPGSLGPLLDTLKFSNLAVQNPGGLNRDPSRWGMVPIAREEFVKALHDARALKFRRGAYFLEKDE